MKFAEIDLKFRIPITGKYAPGVWVCPHCDHEHRTVDQVVNVVGYAETNNGVMEVQECANCFKKFYCHAGPSSYELFVMRVNQGRSNHFKAAPGGHQVPKLIEPPSMGMAKDGDK